MAHESFEDEKVARVLNEHFVCVKVDREERPDVDAAYMTFVQATSGRGGWPMSVFLTSEGEPLFGGTYFPPPMFVELIGKLTSLWTSDRERCLASARDISAQLRDVAQAGIAGTGWEDLPDATLAAKTLRHWLVSFDSQDGGFGSAPKFPSPPNTFHLLHRVAVDSSKPALAESGISPDSAKSAVEASAFSLARIARGGITDHLAGGIARYSVDGEWRVPHFEKMLYDQGQLLTSFAEAVQLCNASSSASLQGYIPEFKEAIQGIVNYLERYMCSPEGSIYAAEDADSLASPDADHAKEGAFYVWDATEIEDVLGKESKAYQLVRQHFGIKLDGNIPAESDPHGELVGKNMLHATTPLSATASKLGMSEEEVRSLWNEARDLLLARREQRPRPMRDDKIITAWNGLAISGLAKAAQVLEADDAGKRALTMAERSANFLWTTMWDREEHQFLRSYRNGTRGPWGFDVDYAFAVQGFLDLYEVTFAKEYLEHALEIQAAQDALFWDSDGPGGYLMSSSDSDGNILGRQRGDQEGAEPTSTSVAAHNLLRLRSLVSDLDGHLATLSKSQGRTSSTMTSRDRIAQSITSGGMVLNRAPHALGTRVTALLHARLGPVQVLVVGPRHAEETQALLRTLHSSFLPRMSVILIDTTDGVTGARKQLGDLLSLGNDAVRQTLDDPKLLERGSYATVCQDFTCGLPIHSPEQLLEQLHS